MIARITIPLCKAGVILGFCVLSVLPAFGQSQQLASPPTLIGGQFTMESSLGLEALDNDNIFQSATNIQESQIWRMEPSLLMRLTPARSRLEFGYDGDYAWYENSEDDDYIDHELEAGAYLLLGERSGLDLIASYDEAHETRGTGLTQGIDPESLAFPESPDRYTNERLLARYILGVSRTRAYVSVEAGSNTLEYMNNRTRTQQFDRKEIDGQITFGVRVRPRTFLEIRARTRDIEYENTRISGASQDSREDRLLLGVVWKATAKTTGTVLVGHVDKSFDDSARPSFSGPNWEVAIRWSPRTYSHLDLGTERYTEEPVELLGDVTDTEIYSLGWTHEWRNRVGSRLTLSRVDRKYRFLTGNREDESLQYSLALGYGMRPWLRWEAGFEFNERDSDLAAYNFDQTILRLGAWITF